MLPLSAGTIRVSLHVLGKCRSIPLPFLFNLCLGHFKIELTCIKRLTPYIFCFDFSSFNLLLAFHLVLKYETSIIKKVPSTVFETLIKEKYERYDGVQLFFESCFQGYAKRIYSLTPV